MEKTDPLIRTKLRLPFIRPGLVSRSRLQEQIAQGVCGPLTLVIAPAGFGKTTLVASGVASVDMPVAWLSLDKNDNQVDRYLTYLIAALKDADKRLGSEASQLIGGMQQPPPETVLTFLINDLDSVGVEIILVLDDYQFISNPAVHEGMTFLLEHCPNTLHLVIASRSDPPLPLTRLRARGQTIELRAADLRFTEAEAAQFLNEVMGLRLDAGSVAALEERTEGWIAGLQMAALSMQNRKDVNSFIEGFSGTNRYILDYLLEEILARQLPEIQRFLLFTSILERLSAPLCDAVMVNDEESTHKGNGQPLLSERTVPSPSISTLEYLEKVNLFLVPLDDERIWYRYHHLFADLLRAQLQKSLDAETIAKLHIRAAEWHGQNGSVLEAIHHAAMASDDERVERFIEQNYMELVSRGEQSGLRFWANKINKELVYNRPWLCIYEAYSHSWFGELDEADLFLEEAEKHIRSEISAPDAHSMLGHIAYIKSRVTAMRGDIYRAIELCLAAREYVPDNNLALRLDTRITLGYEYFLCGDYDNASQILNEMIRSGVAAGAVINTVAAYCLMARLYAVQGVLHKSYDTYQVAAQYIPGARGQHLGARALVEVGIADVLYEWNDLEAAQIHIKQGLAWLPFWDKADDLALAHITLARIYLAQADISNAIEAVEKAVQFIQTRGVFLEARNAAEIAQVKLWLIQGDLQAANHWVAALEQRFVSDDPIRFENELAQITRARVYIAQKKISEAIGLLSDLEKTAHSARRMGRVIEILLLEALALQEIGDTEHAIQVLTKCLTLAEPEGYVRIFLDEGQPMQILLVQWLAHASAGPLRAYAAHLSSQFDAEPHRVAPPQEKIPPTDAHLASAEQALAEPLSQRELEVLHLMALGMTNKKIAERLIVAPGTIKAHAASIYRKLESANRTEAVARARQLGILP